MISKFQNKYQDRKTRGDLQGVQVQFINQKFEDFIPQEKFELAIMWQCIYCILILRERKKRRDTKEEEGYLLFTEIWI